MRLVKTLSAGAALSALLVAAPSFALQAPQEPSSLSRVHQIQASVGEAEAALNDALAKLEEAKAAGADTAELEAAVEQATANLTAAQAAQEGEAAKAAEDAAAAQAAQEAEAAKAAEAAAAAKAAEDAAAAQAAQDAEAAAAAKAAEDAAAAQAAQEAEAAAAAQAAQDAEAAKAAEAAAAAKAAEDAAAAQAAQEAEAAAAKAAEDAAAATKAAEDDAAQAAKDAEAAAAKAAEDAAKAIDNEAAQATKEAEAAAAKAAEEAAAAAKVAEDQAAQAAKDAEAAAAKAAEDATKAVDTEAAQAAKEAEAAAAKAAEEAAAAAKVAEQEAAKAASEAEAAAAKAAEEAAAQAAKDAEAAAAAGQPAVVAPEPVMEPLPDALKEEAAPVLDSAKEELPPAPPPVRGQSQPKPAAIPADPLAPPPVDDAAARIDLIPVIVAPVREEKGELITVFPEAPLPPEEQILKTIGDRIIFSINGLNLVEAPENPRLVRDGDEVIIEQLPRGRTRETIVRANGVQVVTIKNRWGDVIQRSRVLPDGREVILAYTPEYDREEYVEWRDPVYDLPPLQLRVPVQEYILDARLIEDEDVYYRFLDQPPVERVERTYTVQDVKRSARVRDKARRVEMGNITFGFGSADIEEGQIEKMQGLADAMLKLIEKNPAETFLIEGHTDAVGSDTANLALSDKRAESVATALGNVFDVPSENLTTQGYGERYLKVKTGDKEPLNRRVVFRRITPLITPVASAK